MFKGIEKKLEERAEEHLVDGLGKDGKADILDAGTAYWQPGATTIIIPVTNEFLNKLAAKYRNREPAEPTIEEGLTSIRASSQQRELDAWLNAVKS